MLLTLFYAVSSYLKMWQLKTIRTKLLQHVSSSSCVSFYKILSTASTEITEVCSPHCADGSSASVSDLLFERETEKFGCALSPLQKIELGAWRTPTPLPFLPKVGGSRLVSKENLIDVLLECRLRSEDMEKMEALPINNETSDAWKMVAWKVTDSDLAVALQTDISQLTALIYAFLHYDTPITRIMTVRFEDAPVALDEAECAALTLKSPKTSPTHYAEYLKALKTIGQIAPVEEKAPILKRVDLVDEAVQSDIPQSGNGHLEVADPDLTANLNGTPKKPNLKLELNGSAAKDKGKKSLKVSKIVAPEKEFRKNSVEKHSKIGASCPSLPTLKPPNILIYSESAVTQENIAKTLRSVLDPDRYAIYCSGDEGKLESAGATGAALLVVGGALTPRASAALLSAFLGGASILSLCSDLLISVLPFYQTAEVRERELVSFSYENWKSVKLLHNVFCYQASPARRQFSSGSSQAHPSEYKGHGGHNLKVKILAAEQTWHTPSLLRATDDESGGMAVFSQVHLELDSREYLGAEAMASEKARLGVLRKILDGLGLTTAPSPISSIISSEPCYTPAYFLGTYERKQEAAERVAVGCLRLVLPKTTPPPATSKLTPLLLHSCPENFSTLVYFQELATADLGRLLIYSEVLTSTQDIICEQARVHGLVIVADRQTSGHGRGGTKWLSPAGCCMFSMQMYSKMSEIITSRPALMQHMTALAFVSAVRAIPGYEEIDLRIKWPNDIYYGKNIKLGGIVVNTTIFGDQMIFNIGIGINLDNKMPTYCLNDIISKHNSKLKPLEREKVIALTLNYLEKIYDDIQKTNNFEEFYKSYYNYWLHSNQEVLVIEEGVEENVGLKCRILGIDENGYLEAEGPYGKVTLRPDGNTFDMMKGLIAPKLSS